ncbi:hypothetical protein ACIGO7_35315 [Streptomyces virginiae]|uniref:hypothetical protein n=1 Tax=Streptomyces virginiae TaxID=1961 RepID=UPI00344F15BA
MAAAPRKDDSKPTPAVDDSTAAIQKAFDKAQEQGFFGVETDPTPNEHYTVAGVVEGKPTPETNKDAAAEARKAAGLL